MKSSHQIDEEGFLICKRCDIRKLFETEFRPRSKQCRECNRERDREKQEQDNASGSRFCKRCEQNKHPSEFSPGNTQCRPCKSAYTALKSRNAKLSPEMRVKPKALGPNITRERKLDEQGNRWCWKCDCFVNAELFLHDRTLCNPCYLAGQTVRRRAARVNAVEAGLPPRKNARQESGPKTCTVCGVTKEFEDFRMSCYRCKACSSAAMSVKYREDVEASRAYHRARYEADAERQRARGVAYLAANPDKRKAWRKSWNEANKGKVKAQQHNQRARKRSASGKTTYDKLLARIEYYGNKCWMCGYGLVSAMDHVKALCNGGSNWPANYRPACVECNTQKGNWERDKKFTALELHNLPYRMREERANSSKPRREIKTVYTKRKVDGGFASSY